MASVFANVEVGPKIEVFALTKAFQEDPSMVKVNLSVGGKCCLPRFKCMIYLILFFSWVSYSSSILSEISLNSVIILHNQITDKLYIICVISMQSIEMYGKPIYFVLKHRGHFIKVILLA